MKNVIYSHPKFLDVVMVVLKQYFIKETETYALKVKWYKRGEKYRFLASESIRLPKAKFKEFYPCNMKGVPASDIPDLSWVDIVLPEA